MSEKLKNLSSYKPELVPDASHLRFGIVVSEWNMEITHALLKGAIETLQKHGVTEENIEISHVPGSFELTFGARLFAERDDLDSVISLGCVIRGETPHFDFICQSVSHGITELNLEYDIPVIFGVLTTNNMQQAKDRAGGKYGNKGDEAAITAIKMAALNEVK
ncbi:MAG: 6,7-dimethyl-8-ribityllumazine synthase [Bacteroidetes bacterium]|nr:MAG: 6,7-dimethyl-8-ribityllumazine synthase [Bacteroidota bacterium]